MANFSLTEEEQKLYRILIQPVENVELSVRAQNCLNNADIRTLGELCQKTETKMLKYRNFGKKSLDEIIGKMEKMGLSLGMDMSEELNIALNAEAERIRNEEKEEEE